MNNERGSAIIIVLLFLGVMGMVGAGLLLQTQMDTQFTSAVHWSDSRGVLGDMGASTQFRNMPKNPDTSSYSGNPMVTSTCANCPKAEMRPGATDYKGASGTYDYRAVLVGDAPQSECPGFGGLTSITGGKYTGQVPFYWVAEGSGKTIRGGNPEATVQIACTKCR